MGLRGGKGGDWRKLHDEELHDFISSPDIIHVIKRCARLVESMGNEKLIMQVSIVQNGPRSVSLRAG